MKSTLLALFLAPLACGQYLSPQSYAGQQFGLMYSFSISTFCCGNVEGTADPDPNLFAPTNLNIDQWLDYAVLGGAKYVVLTAKWHIGFALWPTAYAVSGHSPYSIAASSWYGSHGNYDIVGNFASKARARGLAVVLYFSIRDLTYESRSGTTAPSDPSDYIAMIKAQLSELLSNYGPITAMWFDGWKWSVPLGGYTYIPYATIANYVKSIQPNCLVFDNNHTFPSGTDLDLYEYAVDGLPPSNNTRPAEVNYALQMIPGGVSSFPAGTPAYTYFQAAAGYTFPAYRLAQQWRQSNAANAAYLINFGVDTTGQLPSEQIAAYRDMLIYRSGTAWSKSSGIGTSVSVSSTDTTDGTSSAALVDGVYENHGGVPFSDIWAPLNSYPAYAEIDLGSILPITKVEAFNRTDSCCKGGFQNLVLTIYDNSHVSVYTGSTFNPGNQLGSGCTAGPAVFTTNLSAASVHGRYVRITSVSDGGCGFALAEISVRTDPQPAGTRGQFQFRSGTRR